MRSRCRRPRTRVQSKHSARRVPTHRSQTALAFGAPDRGQDDAGASSPKHLVKRTRELGIPVVNEELHRSPFLLEGHGEVPGLLSPRRRPGLPSLLPGGPFSCRARSTRARTGSSAGSFHGEEISGQDAPRLGAEELDPRGATPGGRPQTRTPEQGGDGRGRDPHPELQELSLDPQVAPPRVLPGQAEDQFPNLRIQSRPSRREVRPGPLPSDELPVPAEQGLGADQEGSPALPGEDPARSG
jgi:hypothetical protein